jgi:hypothetical protein
MKYCAATLHSIFYGKEQGRNNEYPITIFVQKFYSPTLTSAQQPQQTDYPTKDFQRPSQLKQVFPNSLQINS